MVIPDPTAAPTLADLLTGLQDADSTFRRRPQQTFATGMQPLDRVLNGGFRAHDLSLVGGAPGLGKTIVTLQWARNIARDGANVTYVCYEHDHGDLLGRLFALELGSLAGDADIATAEKLKTTLREAANGARDMMSAIDSEPLARAAYDAVTSYADRLVLVRGSGRYTDIPALERLMESERRTDVLFVDYLQKIAIHPEPDDEKEKVTRVSEGLKELALNHDVAVVAVVAADTAGLQAKRLRLHHLRGSSALSYESDLVILLNDKRQAVSKVHLAYDPVRAETFKQYVIFSLEKNRHGEALVDVEFQKDFSNYRFDPDGGYVAERLIDERVHEE